MDFDSPEVMKDFPGLYSVEKRKGNDSDYNDQNEKATKKDMIIGKRKDKKDKDKGYAALEGESSDEASPCKAKKTKAFIFSKSKDKEKDHSKAECGSKNNQKKKTKLLKSHKSFGHKPSTNGGTQDLAEALPIFGAILKDACQRGKCHDGILIPLPIRECIDFVEAQGLTFENVYKISGNKNKVNQIKKMYNNRQTVVLKEYDVPTVTSTLKAFLRDLPEPLFTNQLLVRFEEAGAILTYETRVKHLSTLLNSLPKENLELLKYLVIHFDNVVEKEHMNKMNKKDLGQAVNNCLQVSSRLIQALITHRTDFFQDAHIEKYSPPLNPGDNYPEDPEKIKFELSKLESAISLIHWEMQQGFSEDARLDQLWDVQRVQTELKRKFKKVTNQHSNTVALGEPDEPPEDHIMDAGDVQEEEAAVESEELDDDDTAPSESQTVCPCDEPSCSSEQREDVNEVYYSEVDCGRKEALVEAEYEQLARDRTNESRNVNQKSSVTPINIHLNSVVSSNNTKEAVEAAEHVEEAINENKDDSSEEYKVCSKQNQEDIEDFHHDAKLTSLQTKNEILIELIDNLSKNISKEKSEIDVYKKKLEALCTLKKTKTTPRLPKNFDEVKDLLIRENHLLEIKKVQLVRQIMEHREQCVNFEARIKLAGVCP